MGNLLAYSGIVTKIRGMEAKLLTETQFDEIKAMKSVPEAVTYLIQNTVYREILETLEPTLVHRGNIEKLLIVSLYQDYTRIYLFATLEQRKFLKLYLKRYEVELINYCLRIVINHYQEPFDLNYKRAFFDRYSQISIEKLIHSRTTDEDVYKRQLEISFNIGAVNGDPDVAPRLCLIGLIEGESVGPNQKALPCFDSITAFTGIKSSLSFCAYVKYVRIPDGRSIGIEGLAVLYSAEKHIDFLK